MSHRATFMTNHNSICIAHIMCIFVMWVNTYIYRHSLVNISSTVQTGKLASFSLLTNSFKQCSRPSKLPTVLTKRQMFLRHSKSEILFYLVPPCLNSMCAPAPDLLSIPVFFGGFQVTRFLQTGILAFPGFWNQDMILKTPSIERTISRYRNEHLQWPDLFSVNSYFI